MRLEENASRERAMPAIVTGQRRAFQGVFVRRRPHVGVFRRPISRGRECASLSRMARPSRCLFVGAIAIAIANALAACGSSAKPVAQPASERLPDASVEHDAATLTDATSATKLLYVSESSAECEGEGKMRCLQVRDSESEPWRLHYGRIEGFRHEEGTRYTLRVEPRDVGLPKADAPSTRLRLVEIVSQEKVSRAGGTAHP